MGEGFMSRFLSAHAVLYGRVSSFEAEVVGVWQEVRSLPQGSSRLTTLSAVVLKLEEKLSQFTDLIMLQLHLLCVEHSQSHNEQDYAQMFVKKFQEIQLLLARTRFEIQWRSLAIDQ